jgi:hypothetical protein
MEIIMKGKILKLNENLHFEEIETKSKEVRYYELKNAIGGYFERVTFNNKLQEAKVNVFVDEEGKIKNLPITVVVFDKGKIVETLVGPLVFTGANDPNMPSITDEQIAVVKDVLSEIAILIGNRTATKPVRILPYK